MAELSREAAPIETQIPQPLGRLGLTLLDSIGRWWWSARFGLGLVQAAMEGMKAPQQRESRAQARVLWRQGQGPAVELESVGPVPLVPPLFSQGGQLLNTRPHLRLLLAVAVGQDEENHTSTEET